MLSHRAARLQRGARQRAPSWRALAPVLPLCAGMFVACGVVRWSTTRPAHKDTHLNAFVQADPLAISPCPISQVSQHSAKRSPREFRCFTPTVVQLQPNSEDDAPLLVDSALCCRRHREVFGRNRHDLRVEPGGRSKSPAAPKRRVSGASAAPARGVLSGARQAREWRAGGARDDDRHVLWRPLECQIRHRKRASQEAPSPAPSSSSRLFLCTVPCDSRSLAPAPGPQVMLGSLADSAPGSGTSASPKPSMP